ncbi:MAG: signal recognition particle subunit SRP19/SEC65 family protein [Archaeoglobaceae archaeon]
MKECVIWRVNLERKKSRAEGRRIPRRFAVPNVRFQEIVEACKALGLNFVAEPEKRYPRCWWEEPGRIRVERRGSKTQLMVEIAKKILEMREAKKKK